MRIALIAVSLLVPLAFAACGDDDSEPEATDPPPVEVGGLFPRHLTAITPDHLATVTGADIRTGEADATDGICASFDFRAGETMGEEPTTRVTLLINEENVTDSSTWVVTDDLPTSSGTICYAPPEPVEGEQTMTLRWTDATDRKFVYAWEFTVAD